MTMRAPAAFDRFGKPLGDVPVTMGVTLWIFYGVVMLAEAHLRLQSWWRAWKEKIR